MIDITRKPAILLNSGRLFNYNDPENSEYDIMDIAAGLATITRFNGQCCGPDRRPIFYSVAQHSVHVSRLVPDHLGYYGLMHDAHEAFIGDMVTQLKGLVPAYRAIEARVEQELHKRFQCSPPDGLSKEAVRQADIVALATEMRDLMDSEKFTWKPLKGVIADEMVISPLSVDEAYHQFLARYHELAAIT